MVVDVLHRDYDAGGAGERRRAGVTRRHRQLNPPLQLGRQRFVVQGARQSQLTGSGIYGEVAQRVAILDAVRHEVIQWWKVNIQGLKQRHKLASTSEECVTVRANNVPLIDKKRHKRKFSKVFHSYANIKRQNRCKLPSIKTC